MRGFYPISVLHCRNCMITAMLFLSFLIFHITRSTAGAPAAPIIKKRHYANNVIIEAFQVVFYLFGITFFFNLYFWKHRIQQAFASRLVGAYCVKGFFTLDFRLTSRGAGRSKFLMCQKTDKYFINF